MRQLSFVHIGDIHYPDHKSKRLADVKDDALSEPFVNLMAPLALKNVVDRINDMLQRRRDIVGFLVSGDLTSRAEMSEYSNCVDFLMNSFGHGGLWNSQTVHVVPGNHDVDRALGSHITNNLYSKFEPISDAWTNKGLPVLQSVGIRSSNYGFPSAASQVYSINSCLGCGEPRYLPEPIRDELQRLVMEYTSNIGLANAFELVGEQLDAPAFSEADLAQLALEIESLPTNTVPIVLGHHGILPQGLVRLAIYSEVVNSGLARFRLSRLRRPVIYCHGHIHEAPVEVVEQPSGGGRLILISAPLLAEGFNIITLHFGRKGLPLGCEITQYEMRSYGSVEVGRVNRIPLVQSGHAHQIKDEINVRVLAALSDAVLRFVEVQREVQTSLGKVLASNVLADRLKELEWFGLVEIANLEEELSFWQIRRIGL